MDEMSLHVEHTLDRMSMRSFRCGSAAHVFIGEDLKVANTLATEAAQKKIKAGKSVTWDNGTSEWINVECQMVPDARDPARRDYVWHEDGDRIKCDRYYVVRTPDGDITRTKLRPVWRDWDKLMNGRGEG